MQPLDNNYVQKDPTQKKMLIPSQINTKKSPKKQFRKLPTDLTSPNAQKEREIYSQRSPDSEINSNELRRSPKTFKVIFFRK